MCTLICVLITLAGFFVPCLAKEPDPKEQREELVRLIKSMGVNNERVLQAIRDVPRHLFVASHFAEIAYVDQPLPIGNAQTISEPYVVAFMTDALKLTPSDRVLEVGTGSGYQAAVLSRLVRKVYTIEIVEPLAVAAAKRLKDLGYANVSVRKGDGYAGWSDAAPFDAIIVTAAAEHIPKPLLDQLKIGGRLVIPLGKDDYQWVLRVTKKEDGLQEEKLLPVRFVPMTGKVEQQEK
jgi:protein-L-isoaspartate(D-aspartate) O-methyltransferase